MAKILDGKATAAAIRLEVASNVTSIKNKYNITPGLAAVLVGDDPASAIYVRNKGRACDEVGIFNQTFQFPADISQEQLLSVIHDLNGDNVFNGILMQLPLPKHIDESAVLWAIDPNKDVDCLHPSNVGRLIQGTTNFLPATPGGVQQLLLRNGFSPDGKHVTICGRSTIVGKPLAILLMQKQHGANATVTICHTGTKNIDELTKQADILVAAMGRPKTITADMVKEGAVVIDVGINRVDDPSRKSGYRLEGDVDFGPVSEKAAAITPVPGGVGPMTIAMLLVNTVTAAKLANIHR